MMRLVSAVREGSQGMWSLRGAERSGDTLRMAIALSDGVVSLEVTLPIVVAAFWGGDATEAWTSRIRSLVLAGLAATVVFFAASPFLLAEPGAPLTEDLLSERVQAMEATAAPPSVLQNRTAAFEREEIVAAIARSRGVKTRAAEELGITYRGLLKKMKRLVM